MPQPTSTAVHVSRPLTNLSVAYIQRAENFIADRVFPAVPVEKQNDQYFTYAKEDWFRDEATVRAPGTESAGGGYSLGTDTYACVVEAYHKDIDEQTRANADEAINVDREASEFVAQKLLIRRERQWVSRFFGTGIWGTDVTGVASGATGGQVNQWNGAAADPVVDIDAAKMAMAGVTGFMPNVLVLGPQVFAALRSNPRIRDQVKYTSRDSIDTSILAAVFGVERVLVPMGVVTTSPEGAASATTGFIFGKSALLAYAAPNPGLMIPSAGYTFVWRGFAGSINGMRTSRLDVPLKRAERIEGEMAYTQKRVSADLGYFFSGVVA